AGSLPESVRVPGRTLTGLGVAERAGARVTSEIKSPDAPGDASEPRSRDGGSIPPTSTEALAVTFRFRLSDSSAGAGNEAELASFSKFPQNTSFLTELRAAKREHGGRRGR